MLCPPFSMAKTFSGPPFCRGKTSRAPPPSRFVAPPLPVILTSPLGTGNLLLGGGEGLQNGSKPFCNPPPPRPFRQGWGKTFCAPLLFVHPPPPPWLQHSCIFELEDRPYIGRLSTAIYRRTASTSVSPSWVCFVPFVATSSLAPVL